MNFIDYEMPDLIETENDQTQVVQKKLPPKKRVLEMLRESIGESFSIEDIAEETDLSEEKAEEVLRRLCKESESTREVYEDENLPGHFFATTPVVDRVNLGF